MLHLFGYTPQQTSRRALLIVDTSMVSVTDALPAGVLHLCVGTALPTTTGFQGPLMWVTLAPGLITSATSKSIKWWLASLIDQGMLTCYLYYIRNGNIN